MQFTTESMLEILSLLKRELILKNIVTFEVLNPDLLMQKYTGEQVTIKGISYLYRGFKSWVDLAEILRCKMSIPQATTYPYIQLTFHALSEKKSFHQEFSHQEKYGVGSLFAKIHKMEEPAFVYYYTEALHHVAIEKRSRVLNLGINRGDEFALLQQSIHPQQYQKMELIGVDYSQSAIAYAKRRFPESNVKLYRHDINALENLQLGLFDLMITIGTLQSVSPDRFKPLFMDIVQNYLAKDAAIIMGFPNARWIDGEMIYGAKPPHYRMNEMGQLLTDILFCKKYLQQKKYRVTITGKQYLFLTATKLPL